jgi:hypothetical protein
MKPHIFPVRCALSAALLIVSFGVQGADDPPAKRVSRKEATQAAAFFGIPSSVNLTPDQKESLVSAFKDLAPKILEAEQKNRGLLQQQYQQTINTPRRGRRGSAPQLPAGHAKDLAANRKEMEDLRAEMKHRVMGVLTEKQKAKLHLTESDGKSVTHKDAHSKPAAKSAAKKKTDKST